MRCRTSTHPLLDGDFDAVVVPVFAGGELPERVRSAAGVPPGLAGIAARFDLRTAGDACWVPAAESGPDVLLMCVGPSVDGEATGEGLRAASMVAGRGVGR
ncbi:hypothetical protein, partial [Actinoallomurus acaciae]